MNSVDLYKLKSEIECLYLNDDIVQFINNIMSKSNIKPIKTVKKQVNVMKTNKIQAKKDLNENKLIMIMNKISDNNINMLVIEYLNNIMIDTEEKYNMIQEEIFNKMIKDTKFINNYIKFAINIFMIERQRLNLMPEHFIQNIINNIENENENIRMGIFEMIKKLVNNGFFNNNIMDHIANIILSREEPTMYIDVYHWFNGGDCTAYIDKINNIINSCEEFNMTREKILIESVIEKVPIKIATNTIVEDTNEIGVSNIIEEFLFIGEIDEVVNYINNECKEIDEKNNFAKYVFINYIKTFNEKLFEMFEVLIKNKILFKSNLSKGLILLLQEGDKDRDAIINILKFLKNQNITKNIESIFKKYKVKIYYD